MFEMVELLIAVLFIFEFCDMEHVPALSFTKVEFNHYIEGYFLNKIFYQKAQIQH
jgi:hypothetical protein